MNIDLPAIAKNVRMDILTMSFNAKSAHMGGALSVVEILVTLYFDVMRVDGAGRDRLVFSKAHDAKALYSVLARRGYFDLSVLDGYEKNGGKLPGHSTRNCVPGVEVSAGSLGHGLSMAVGMAYALKKIKPRVFAILSDGECDEGSVWEAALFAGHHKLENLTVIVDYNTLQGFGNVADVLNLEPFADKWRAFGFETKEVDGHSFDELRSAFTSKHNKPLVVIARTVKGKGGPPIHVNQLSSQYKPPTEEEFKELA